MAFWGKGRGRLDSQPDLLRGMPWGRGKEEKRYKNLLGNREHPLEVKLEKMLKVTWELLTLVTAIFMDSSKRR